MDVTIQGMSAREGGKVAVTFAFRGGEQQSKTLLLSASSVADLSLCLGDCSEELYEAAEREEALEQAVERGLRILGCGGISQRALENRLTQKGVKRQLAKEAAEQLAQRGYLNENAQALREAERCVGKLWGPRRIEASLRSKGYSSEVVQRAMYALEDEGTDFVHLCAERIRGQKQEPPREPRERQKWMAALSRYGFSGSEIREALRLLKQEQTAEE